MTLERALSFEALSPDPRGKYFVGNTWLSFFAPHGRFSGTIVWGEPSKADVAAWEACADLRLSPVCEPHATIFDAHAVERLGPTAFGQLAKYATGHMSELGNSITKLAIVHTGTFAGAVAAGFTKLVPVPFPTEVFTDVASALAWLGCEGARRSVTARRVRSRRTGTTTAAGETSPAISPRRTTSSASSSSPEICAT